MTVQSKLVLIVASFVAVTGGFVWLAHDVNPAFVIGALASFIGHVVALMSLSCPTCHAGVLLDDGGPRGLRITLPRTCLHCGESLR
jgi:hypothetical protein